MLIMIKVLAVVGAIWAVCLGILLLLISLWAGQPNVFAFVIMTALLFMFQRLYSLKLWALAATCLYCCGMTVGSPGSGIWQWTLGWAGIACLTIFLLVLNWKRLETSL